MKLSKNETIFKKFEIINKEQYLYIFPIPFPFYPEHFFIS